VSETFHVVPVSVHESLVRAAYLKRGFTVEEAGHAATLASAATRHGIRTHNAIKALHLDDLFGSKAGGCVPRAEIRRLPQRFSACETWDAGRKLGQAVAWEAIEACIRLADRHGTGTVAVDNAFHYLWGGGYVMEAARRGYIAYTNCTASLAEVVPFRGVFPTLGTNPHSWGFPTVESRGLPLVFDWATCVIVKAVVEDILGHGNESCLLPGQPEAQAAARSDAAGGLLFSTAEIDALNDIAREAGEPLLDAAALPVA
jgi:ureidoglycolate dehydrogenase (NAD+)